VYKKSAFIVLLVAVLGIIVMKFYASFLPVAKPKYQQSSNIDEHENESSIIMAHSKYQSSTTQETKIL